MGNRQSQSQFQSQSSLKNSNINLNINIGKDYSKIRHREHIADELADKFNNHKFRGFYWKVANKLSESRIQQHIETANGNGRYFTNLCKRDGV